jgi:hypothetical protein
LKVKTINEQDVENRSSIHKTKLKKRKPAKTK